MAPLLKNQSASVDTVLPTSAGKTGSDKRRKSSSKAVDAHNTSDERVNNLTSTETSPARDEAMDTSPASAKRRSPGIVASDDDADNGESTSSDAGRGKKPRRVSAYAPATQLSSHVDRINASLALSASLAAVDNTFQDADGFLPGSIRRINVKNFMCHENLTINFQPRINFVTGRNGSGKSAILTAMVLALGGSASNTNRGSSMKTFVRTGCRRAEITITIANVGPDAFEPEKYGPRIEVVRGLAADGAAPGYRIKSAGGRVVGTKREIVRSIADRFNLPVSSPLCIMNQDTSRTFLKNVDARAMYSLFIRALQLDLINVDLNNISAHKLRMEQLATPINTQYKKLKSEKKELEKKLEAFVSIEEKRTVFRLAKYRFEWAIVSSIERDITEDAGKMEEEREKIDALEQSMQQIPEKRKMIVDKMAGIDEQIAAIEEEMAGFAVVKQQKESAAREIRKKYDAAKRAVERCDANLNGKKTQLNGILKNIDELREKDGSNVIFRKRLDMLEKIKEFQAEIAEAKQQEKELDAELTESRRIVDEADNEVRNRVRAVEADTHKQKGMESALTNLKRARTSAFAVYGESMARLKTEIERRTKEFERVPIGPLGAYVRVRDPAWSLVVEQSLGQNLKAFLVTSRADERLLQKCMQSARMPPGDMPLIICGKFGDSIYDYERDKPYVRASGNQANKNAVGEFYTLLELLDVPENDDRIAVVNCLIDQARAVQTLFMRTMEQARDACMHRLLSDTAGKVFDLSGNMHIMLPSYKFYAGNGMQKTARYLIKDNAQAIAQLTEDLQNQELVVEAAREALAAARSEKAEAAKKLTDIEKQLKQCRDRISTLSKKVTKLQAEMPDEPPPTTSLIADMENKLENIQQEIETAEADRRESKAELDELAEKVKDAYAEAKQYENNETAKAGEKTSAESLKAVQELELDKLTRAIRKGATKKQEHLNEIERLKKCEVDMRNKIEERLKKLADEQQTERPDPALEDLPLNTLRDNVQAAKNEFLDLKARVEHSRGLNEDELRERAAAVDLELHDLREQHTYIKFIMGNVDNICRGRLKHMSKVIKRTTEYVAQYFENFLATRDFKGKLDVDHHAKELKLSVRPPQRADKSSSSTQSSSQSKFMSGDVRQLSGGERSYAMVSLISAMWMNTDMPIRMIDEFDVFMDPVNRTFALNMLVSAARDQQKQFVFLTPLALPTDTLKADEFPIVMPEPRPDQVEGGRARGGAARAARNNIDEHLQQND